MNTWFSFLSLMVAIGLCLWKTKNKTVRLYFWAQLLNAPIVFFCGKYLTDQTLHATVYEAATLPILECCCLLIWESCPSKALLFTAVDFGFLIGIIAAPGMAGHQMTDYVTFVEGVMLSTLGLALALVASGSMDKFPLRIISALSFALSSYDFAFLLNKDLVEQYNWLPSAMCTTAFLLFAVVLEIRTVLKRERLWNSRWSAPT